MGFLKGRKVWLVVFGLLLAGGLYALGQKSVTTQTFRDVPDPGEEETQQMLTGVKDVHIYICYSLRTPDNIMARLQPDSLAQMVSEDIKAYLYPGIHFADGKIHEPVISARQCGLRPEWGLGDL